MNTAQKPTRRLRYTFRGVATFMLFLAEADAAFIRRMLRSMERRPDTPAVLVNYCQALLRCRQRETQGTPPGQAAAKRKASR